MSKAPKFSVIVPAYNVGTYLEQCLDSLVNQTFRDFEVIVVDDASPDACSAIADEYADRDSRIHVVHKGQNEGLHRARKTGAGVARGEWTLFVDGDDELEHDALEQASAYCTPADNDFIRFGITVTPENGASLVDAMTLETLYNSGSGRLTGSEKLSATFADSPKQHVTWTSVATAFRTQLCKIAFSSMTSRRLERLEDAYEYFVLADQAKAINLCTNVHILKYHWGRGITGSNRLTLEAFTHEVYDMKDVCEAAREYVDRHPSQEAQDAYTWLTHEIPKHVSTTLALRVSPSIQERAVLAFANIWDADTVQAEIYRLVADRAHALTQGHAIPNPDDEIFRDLQLVDMMHLVREYTKPELRESSYVTDNRTAAQDNLTALNQAIADETDQTKRKTPEFSRALALEPTASGKRRLAIFCFFDPNGHAASYIRPFLDDLKQNVTDIVVVSNGDVDEPTRKFFSQYTDTLIERENKGLDVAAYRQGMLTLGWEKLESYDEVICLNDTIMGPVYPFAEMFQTMDARPVDFWGITAYPAETVNHEDIPTHLQAYWHAYRKSLVSSQAFHDYWENMPEWDGYAEVTRKHEMQFTKHFADLGFKWDAYIDWEKYKGTSSYPLLYMPTQLIRDERCPIFKRRSFFVDYSVYFDQTAGQPALDLYDYLRDNTVYDMNLVWDALLQSYNVADIRKALHLDYVLPEKALTPSSTPHPKSAFIFHIYFMDLLADTCRYLANIPSETDLYITTTADKIDQITQAMRDFGIRRQPTFITVQNRGRDVSALLVAAKDVVLGGKYEVVGFAHDKKSSQNQETGHHGTETQGFTYKLMENTLGSEQYVKNVLTLFADNPRLGIISPMPPYHALYFAHTLPLDWGPNFEITKDLLENRLGLHVPLDPAKPTMSAMGSCYWFRTAALKKLFEANWTYEDFLPEGQMGPDGTISHAIERANGYVAQAAGYYPAWVMSDRYARIEVDSLLYTTNSLIGAMGPYRSGETLLANCAGLTHSLGKSILVKRKVVHGIHRVLAATAHIVTAPMSEKMKARMYNGAWSLVHKIRH